MEERSQFQLILTEPAFATVGSPSLTPRGLHRLAESPRAVCAINL